MDDLFILVIEWIFLTVPGKFPIFFSHEKLTKHRGRCIQFIYPSAQPTVGWAVFAKDGVLSIDNNLTHKIKYNLLPCLNTNVNVNLDDSCVFHHHYLCGYKKSTWDSDIITITNCWEERMEFPELGKNCSNKTCKQLGKQHNLCFWNSIYYDFILMLTEISEWLSERVYM